MDRQSLLLMVLSLAVIVVAPLAGPAQDSPGVVDLLGQTVAESQSQETVDLTSSEMQLLDDWIPPLAPSGDPYSFHPVFDAPMTVAAPSRPGFDPFEDAPSFVNPSSVSSWDGGDAYRLDQFNGGTCWGVSFFTGLWYSRLIRPVQQAGSAPLPASFERDRLDVVAGLGAGEGTAQGPRSGLDVVIGHAPEGAKPLGFAVEDMRRNLADYRLARLSKGPYRPAVERAMVGHHRDQQASRTLNMSVNTGEMDSAFPIDRLLSRLERDGVMMTGWTRYVVAPVPGAGYSAPRWDSGHSLLAYRASRVTVEAAPDQRHEAYRVDFFDPNFVPKRTFGERVGNFFGGLFGREQRQEAPDEGSLEERTGTYFLFFPSTGQTSFAAAYRTDYGLQSGSSTVDGDLTKLTIEDCLDEANLREVLSHQTTFQSNRFDGATVDGRTAANLATAERTVRALTERRGAAAAQAMPVLEDARVAFNRSWTLEQQEWAAYQQAVALHREEVTRRQKNGESLDGLRPPAFVPSPELLQARRDTAEAQQRTEEAMRPVNELTRQIDAYRYVDINGLPVTPPASGGQQQLQQQPQPPPAPSPLPVYYVPGS